MPSDHWILVVEPSESDRLLIEFAVEGVCPRIPIVFVSEFHEFIPSISKHGSMPTLVILDWPADGDAPVSCLDTLARLGFLPRLPVIVVAREKLGVAIAQTGGLGVQRFVSKQPDDHCFREKLGEAIADCVPQL